MKQLYAKHGIELWCGDAEDFDWPVDLDLLVTDPPYGKKYRSNQGTQQEEISGDTDQAKIDRILRAVWSRIRPTRHAYIFGPQRTLASNDGTKTAELIWDKFYTVPGANDVAWGTSHERIGFYAHRYKSQPEAGKLVARLRQGTVLRAAPPRGSVKRWHPNEKPVRLVQQLIESSSVVGDLVVDPFAGAGSVPLACRLLGRRCIAIELDLKYAERAAERLDSLSLPW